MGSLIIQRPAAGGAPAPELLLLFHGVGSNAEDLRPLGDFLAEARPQAAVVSVQSPDRSEMGAGWQWFSVLGITEQNRPERVAAALPAFVRTVQELQRTWNADVARTTLIGFSQGGIMALEASQLAEPLAGRVIAIGARFATPPRVAPAATALHLMQGEADGVMPKALAVDAAARLQALGATVSCDLFPGVGHGIDGRVARRIVERLEGTGA
jgi:phospholipase/carboxylesterase